MNLRWYSVVVDCRDIAAQARWWAEVLDWQIVYEADDEVAIVPKRFPAGIDVTQPIPAEQWDLAGPGLVFVPVTEGKTVKNRLHLDLAPHSDDDREAQLNRLIAAGATRVDVGQQESATWTVLADPEGNEFCVLSSRSR